MVSLPECRCHVRAAQSQQSRRRSRRFSSEPAPSGSSRLDSFLLDFPSSIPSESRVPSDAIGIPDPMVSRCEALGKRIGCFADQHASSWRRRTPKGITRIQHEAGCSVCCCDGDHVTEFKSKLSSQSESRQHHPDQDQPRLGCLAGMIVTIDLRVFVPS
eukprot:2083122-Rhodomonas_salina.2